MPPHDVSSVLWRLGSQGDVKILLLAATLHGECHRTLALPLEPALIPHSKGAGIFGVFLYPIRWLFPHILVFLVVNKNLSIFWFYFIFFWSSILCPQCNGDIIAARAEHSENLSINDEKLGVFSPSAGAVSADTILHDENTMLSLSSRGEMCSARLGELPGRNEMFF